MADFLSATPQAPLQENHMANNIDTDVSPPVAPEPFKKRKSEGAENEAIDARKRRESGQNTVDKNCHQCHQRKENFLQCTVLKTRGKRLERCGGIFCQSCLSRRYDQDADKILAAGRPSDPTKLLGHVLSEQYMWKCPICAKACNCHVHRKEYGLPLAGNVEKLAKEAGVSVSVLLNDTIALEAAKVAKKEKDEQRAREKASKASEAAASDAAKKSKQPKQPKPLEPAEPKTKEPKTKKLLGQGTSREEVAMIMATNAVPQDPKKAVAPKPPPPAPTTKTSAMPPKMPPKPKPFAKCPKAVATPNFEFIAISHPLSVIAKRLRVREFVLRFEKQLMRLQSAPLPAKYIRIMNDPNDNWTDLTYRNLICTLLSVMQPDNTFLDSSFVKEGINQIQHTQPDSPKVWTITKSLLEGILEVDDLNDFEDEDNRLELVMSLLDMAVASGLVRHQLEKDMEKQKEIHKAMVDKIKQLKIDWEEQKTVLQKDRVLVKAEERLVLDERYSNAQSVHRRLVALEEQDAWFKSRKLACRTTPLGVDPKGNVYHHFIQREKDAEDWGQWVVVERGADLPHPSGDLPKFDAPILPTEDDDDHVSLPEPDDEAVVRSRIWYAVSTAADIRHLASWIQYQADLIWYKAAMAEQPRPLTNGKQPTTPVMSVPGSPSRSNGSGITTPLTPSRQVMTEVRLPLKTPTQKLTSQEQMTRESIDTLVHHLRKIAGFTELDEQGVGKI